jgi:ribosomal-protein-alanine N-acetyltransferase
MRNYFLCPNGDLVRLRDATPSDTAEMRRLEQGSPTASHWSESQYQSLFDDSTASRVVRIAEDEFGEIKGFVIVRCLADEWEIENIVVASSCRRRGVGSRLLGDLLGRARSREARNLFLEVRESNEAALRLYEKIGFSVEGRRKDYYRNPTEDAILYRLSLHLCDKIS